MLLWVHMTITFFPNQGASVPSCCLCALAGPAAAKEWRTLLVFPGQVVFSLYLCAPVGEGEQKQGKEGGGASRTCQPPPPPPANRPLLPAPFVRFQAKGQGAGTDAHIHF